MGRKVHIRPPSPRRRPVRYYLMHDQGRAGTLCGAEPTTRDVSYVAARDRVTLDEWVSCDECRTRYLRRQDHDERTDR